VYERTKTVKIGSAVDAQRRLKHLQAASADPLVLLGVVPGAIPDEKRLQRKFMDHRERGEWFRPAPELMAFIGQLARAVAEPVPATSDQPTPVPRRRLPARRNHVPTYRRHKASGQAAVKLNSVYHYIDQWNSPDSKAEYERVIGEWLVRGRLLPDRRSDDKPGDMRLKELILGYYGHVAPTLPEVEVDKLKRALKPVRELFGKIRASKFGPVQYKAVRAAMVDGGLCISTINQRLGVVRRMVALGVENAMLPGDALHRLDAVAPLKGGRDAPAPRSSARPRRRHRRRSAVHERVRANYGYVATPDRHEARRGGLSDDQPDRPHY
jgi:hypothetical protein